MKTGKTYWVRFTLPKLCNHPRIKTLKKCYFLKAELRRVLKTSFVFKFDLYGEVKVPFNAIEVFDIINRPINLVWLLSRSEKVLNKFSKFGFNKLTDHELLIILANQYVRFYRNGDDFFPLHLATGIEQKNITRGDIIRELRGTFKFRNTADERKKYKNFKSEEWSWRFREN